MDTVRFQVVFRENADEPQQTIELSTKEAANGMAYKVIQNGGVAIVIPVTTKSPIGARSA